MPQHIASVAAAATAAAVNILPQQHLRMSAVVRLTGLGRSTIYRLIAAKQFPSPVRLAGRAVGWRRADLDRWSESLPAAGH
ncbi:AlpA family transcriptional regulator [Ideonella sp. A 288]|uniref:helix-turn-helix transcriptional regulator n=1 Tax=Ideonella sp. A 288 TaxID=1962181 RepID=UPI000B4AAC3E|nr:AlpA family phage regulatory protein [Ideonella sp. A 288]